MATRVAINGFGRIGRAFYRLAKENSQIDIVAINDLGDIGNLAYLLKYDSAYGKVSYSVESKEGALVVDGKEIKYISEKNPGNLPWKELDIDVVIESTGVFAGYEKSRPHIEAGAKKVVITAPVKDEPQDDIPGATVLMGINEEKLQTCTISANASCTTNAASPVISIVQESLGIEKALLNTIHGYTSSQSIIDGPNARDFRRGRAGALNIVPSSTGAALAVTKAIPDIPFFDGIAVRVPVVVGSYVDLTLVSKKETSKDEINEILKKASEDVRWKGIFIVNEEPLVSSDIVGNTHASIADLPMTRVVGGNLVKILSWYDNEMGYANTLVMHVLKTASHIS